jgi:hypothetical protein
VSHFSRSVPMLTRRGLLRGAGKGAAVVTGAVAVPTLTAPASAQQSPPSPLGQEPAGLPARQFGWGATLAKDTYGNLVSPCFDRLLLFTVRPGVSATGARTLEAALRTLERRFRWGPDGLLFTVGWGPHYFTHVLRVDSPIPDPRRLSTFEHPVLDDYDVCLHIACDDESRLAAVEAALLHGHALTGADGPLLITGPLRWHETRTGFTGVGLPARYQHVAGIPSGNPVPKDSPLFMGFKSGLLKNQATEDSVTIADGPFAGGTTMHVSYMHLNLEHWYDQDTERKRVQEMYAAQVTPAEVPKISTESPNHANQFQQAVSHYHVVGHSQTSARARRNGKPIILRRDFNTVDGGHSGLHFVSLQQTIEDFITTRTEMNGAQAAAESKHITATKNNGINAYMLVHRRANYILPSRADRAFPLLPGRAQALE